MSPDLAGERGNRRLAGSACDGHHRLRLLAIEIRGSNRQETAGVFDNENRNGGFDGVSSNGHGSTPRGRVGHEAGTVGLGTGNGDESHAGRDLPAIGGQAGDLQRPYRSVQLFPKFRKPKSGNVPQFHRIHISLSRRRAPMANRLRHSFRLNKTPTWPSRRHRTSVPHQGSVPPAQ
jgi:hypothetical protein